MYPVDYNQGELIAVEFLVGILACSGYQAYKGEKSAYFLECQGNFLP